MSNTPNYDKKVKAILDEFTPGERTCEMTGEKWMVDEREIEWTKRFNVPPSPFSPESRLLLLSTFFLTYQWWWNKHFDTGEPVLTSVHPASGMKVLPDKEWFERDFSDTNLDLDVNRPFFDAFRELQVQIPMTATRNMVPPENSITQFSMGDSNSYFVASSTTKNCLYLNDCQDAESSMDSMAGINITDCYHTSHSSRLHQCKFVYESFDCVNSSFLFDCRNCENCFGASNKRNKKYLFFNEQLTKQEWEKRVAEIDLGDYEVLQQMKKKFHEMIGEAVWPENFNIQTTDSTGDYLIKCSDNFRSSYGRDGHHNYYCYGLWGGAEGNAFSCAVPGSFSYQAGPLGDSANIKFSPFMMRCDDCEYSFGCYECVHCFGCVGLRNKKFHIFNKEYSEEEYWKKVDELKCAMLDRGEYGRPFPGTFSTSYFPIGGPIMYMGAEMEDWDVIGMKRFEIDAEGAFGAMRTDGKDVLQPEEVPSHINDLDDSWAGKIVMDTEIKRPFTFLKPEIAFLKKHNIAPSRQHFTARIRDIMWTMNTAMLEDMTCGKCNEDILVAKNRTFKNRKIYCNKCYLEYLEQYG